MSLQDDIDTLWQVLRMMRRAVANTKGVQKIDLVSVDILLDELGKRRAARLGIKNEEAAQ